MYFHMCVYMAIHMYMCVSVHYCSTACTSTCMYMYFHMCVYMAVHMYIHIVHVCFGA